MKSSTVVIITRNHLLGHQLALKFAQSELSSALFHLPPSTMSFKIVDPRVTQENFSPSTIVSSADYYLIIYPQLTDLPLINKLSAQAEDTNTKLCLILNYRDLRLLQTFKSQFSNKVNSRYLIVTDPYGPYFVDGSDPLSDLISSASLRGSLKVTDSGKLDLYPTYVDDLTPVILKTLFTSGTQDQTFWLSTLESNKNLDIAYQLVNLTAEVLDQNIELSVVDDRTTPVDIDTDAIALAQSQLSWEPTTELESGIRRTLEVSVPRALEKPKPKAPVDVTKLPPMQRKVRRFFNPKVWMLVSFVTAVATLLALPLILFAINSYFGAGDLKNAVAEIQQGNTEKSRQLAQSATASFGRSRVLLQGSSPILLAVPQSTLLQTDKLLDALTRLSVVITTASNTVGQADGLYKIILGGEAGDFSDSVSMLKASLDTLYSELSLVKVALEKVDLSSNLEFFGTLNSAKKQLPDMLSQLQLGLSSLDLLPQMIGSDTPKTYLILLQNNAELRPTGGFIGSYALATFQNGRLLDLKVDDVYNADGQLAGHVEPPPPIKKYLGEANWYLRDANWYPSFPNTARQIEWFIQKELGRDVQGVIAINLYTVKDLLQATGPIVIPEFQETITADNLFERAEYRSEVNFFPGSTQKRDFLSALTNQLLNEIKSGKVPLAKLAASFDRSLRERQILIMSNDAQVQTSLESLNWSGSIKNLPCPSTFNVGCTSSTFALIEANLGVNKANYFLNRQIKQSVLIERDGRLNYQIAVSYKNNSTSTAWPGGRYKTYTRLYVPLGTDVSSVKFDGIDLTPDSVTPQPDLGLTEIALYYEVPINTTSNLEVNLRTNQILATQSNQSALSINWLKQSGTGPDPLSININYPQYLIPTQMNLPAENPPQQLNLSTVLSSNISFAVMFQKN